MFRAGLARKGPDMRRLLVRIAGARFGDSAEDAVAGYLDGLEDPDVLAAVENLIVSSETCDALLAGLNGR